MAKVFEDYFSEFQTDMVSICMAYVENVADKIYIHCSYEAGVISSNYFYCINGQVKKKHKINECGSIQYDVSPARQEKVLDILIEDIKKIKNLCEEYKREMPTEMKLIYDVQTRKFNAEYSYELMYSNNPVKTADDIAYEWLEEVKKVIESCA
jgi:hypothetical protein